MFCLLFDNSRLNERTTDVLWDGNFGESFHNANILDSI